MARRIRGLIYHWSASGPKTTVEQIRKWHKAKGWRDIGYHRVILHPEAEPRAQFWWDLVKLGRHLDNDLFIEDDEIGAHAIGFNRDFVGICVVGGPGNVLDPLQGEAIIKSAEVLCNRYALSFNTVCGHRDKNPTQCPGDEIYQIIKDIRAGVYFD